MYVPDPFREDRPDVLQDAVRRIGFATLVTQGLDANHLPMALDGTMLRGHVARAIDNGVTKDEINAALTAASEGYLKGVLGVTNEPLVSVDFNHQPASSTAALNQTQVIEGQLARILTWYDNEWGFSTRMADTALAMGKLI